MMCIDAQCVALCKSPLAHHTVDQTLCVGLRRGSAERIECKLCGAHKSSRAVWRTRARRTIYYIYLYIYTYTAARLFLGLNGRALCAVGWQVAPKINIDGTFCRLYSFSARM